MTLAVEIPPMDLSLLSTVMALQTHWVLLPHRHCLSTYLYASFALVSMLRARDVPCESGYNGLST